MKKSLIPCLLFLLACSCSKPKHSVDFLLGEWKLDAEEDIYEFWEKDGSGLKGYAYSIDEGQKNISETLKIVVEGKKLIYQATVPDQNQGKTISFTLNPEIDSLYSFENLQHDFPKRVQYKILSDSSLEVRVSGDRGKGFSYIQYKQ